MRRSGRLPGLLEIRGALEMNYIELPDNLRLRINATIYDLGGHVAGYSGQDIIVAMPREGRNHLIYYLDRVGLTVSDMCYFPICGDNPPDHLRNFCFRYQSIKDRPAYWLYYRWRIKAEEVKKYENYKRLQGSEK